MRLQDWSGDWVSLAEAAKIVGKALGAKKTEEDILKAGYLQYQGIDRLLKIYSFVRTMTKITASEVSEQLRELLPPAPYKDKDTGEEKIHDPWGEPLTEAEKKATTAVLTAGDIFELNWIYLEKIALLHHWHTMAGGVVFTALSLEELPGWESAGDYWKAEFNARMDPDIEILWDDLRVDRQELFEFIEQAKKAKESEAGGLDAAIDKHGPTITRKLLIKTYESQWESAERDLSEKSRNGLDCASVPGQRLYYLNAALEWARKNGKFVERAPIPGNSIHNAPTSVVHKSFGK